MPLNKYYAYIHQNGELIVKRFFDDNDIIEAQESSFVVKTIGPFLSRSIDNAKQKALSIVFSNNSKKIIDISKKF